MSTKVIHILANVESIVVKNSADMEHAHISWSSLPNLGARLRTREDFINALTALVHADPSAEIRVSKEAEVLLAKAVETVSNLS